MKKSNRVNQFNGWTKESQRRLTRDLNNLTPAKRSFNELMKEWMK